MKNLIVSNHSGRKYLFYFLFICGFCFCKPAYAQTDSSYFRLIKATAQSWAGGPYGSGSGTYYNFLITFNKKTSISFDSVWINNTYKHFYSRSNLNLRPLSVIKGDSVVLSADFYYPGEKDLFPGYQEPVKSTNPCKKSDAKAVIIFRVKEKVYYYEVLNIVGLEPINYP